MAQTTSERLTQLQQELDALRQVQTQEDFDEGARLHAAKNAPWVSGMYSHLPPAILNPPYVYKAFPAAVYHVQYGPMRKEWLESFHIQVYGNDQTRELAIQRAEKAMNDCVKLIHSQAEAGELGDAWAPTPAEAERRRLAAEREVEVQAGHLNYEDRNLTGPALAERELADDLSDGHLVDVTGTLEAAGKLPAKRGRPKKEAVEA